MNKIKAITLITLLPFMLLCTAYANTIVVGNQSDFDNLKSKILKGINAGEKEIYVSFVRGTYVFKDNHIVLSRLKAADTRVHFIGNGAVLIPEGCKYYSGDIYEGEFKYDNSWMEKGADNTIWTQMRYADNLIELVEPGTKLCRLKNDLFKGCSYEKGSAYIHITHWFQSSIYKIEKIKSGYVYFKAPDLGRSSLDGKGYNLNDDYYFYKSFPRFRLCNVDTGEDVLKINEGKVVLPSGCHVVYEGKSPRFLTIQVSTLASFDIKDFVFYGNSYQASTSYMYFYEVKAKAIGIENCVFAGLHGNPISIVNTDNVSVYRNKFTDCYYGGILSDNMSANTSVVNNTFENMGLRIQNTFAVTCRGTNYYIADNSFENYGAGGISVGDWSHNPHERPSSGVVENNVLTYLPDYLIWVEKNGLMDSGAIYVWTKNDGAIIRNNVIKNYSGAGGNKGIFCDNGSYGVSIIGNLVTGVKNSFSITARRVANVEETKSAGTGIVASNINNIIKDNIIDGSLFFAGHERMDNGCEYGVNYLLVPEGAASPRVTVSNVTETGEDVLLEIKGEKKDRIAINRTGYRSVKKVLGCKTTRRMFVRQ